MHSDAGCRQMAGLRAEKCSKHSSASAFTVLSPQAQSSAVSSMLWATALMYTCADAAAHPDKPVAICLLFCRYLSAQTIATYSCTTAAGSYIHMLHADTAGPLAPGTAPRLCTYALGH